MISKEVRDKIHEILNHVGIDGRYSIENIVQEIADALTAEDVVFEDTLRGTGWLPKSQALTAEDEPKCIPVRGVNCKECSAYFMDLIKHHKEHHTAEDECPNCQGLRWYTLGEKDSQGRYTLEDESFEDILKHELDKITAEDECDHEWEEVAVDWYRCKKCGAKDYTAED